MHLCSVQKNKSINRSAWNIKKKIMDIKKITNELCVEVYATDNEGTTMIIKKAIGEEGVHGTYMNIYYTLMNMKKKCKMGCKIDTGASYRDWETDRKSTRLNSSHSAKSRMPSSA